MYTSDQQLLDISTHISEVPDCFIALASPRVVIIECPDQDSSDILRILLQAHHYLAISQVSRLSELYYVIVYFQPANTLTI